ncbi:MAG TPA: virulence-associated E family protein [Roseococcus sp.]|nr:virulence-associated E family protein [Roseococcus sp.]
MAELDQRMDCDDRKQPYATLANAMLVMALDPAVAGRLCHCDFRDVSLLTGPPPKGNPSDPHAPGPYPRPWTRADAALFAAYIQRTYTHKMRRETVEDAMEVEAARNRWHPIRDWLASLTWDRIPRLHRLIPQGFGANPTPYTQAIGAKLCIAAVRRVRQPGVKFDHVPVAQGAQGRGKSTAWAALFGPDLFSDALPDDLADKDAAMALRGVWGLEMAELTQLLASEPEAIKAFITRAVDRYRPPYGRVVLEVPRQGVLVGTTNAQEWLRDPTGNRRFWPFDCGEIDVEWIRANREQLWAEAAQREAEAEPHWLDEADDREEAEAQQQERMVEDPWHWKVRDYVDGLRDVKASVLLEHAINMPVYQQTRQAQMRIAAILTRLGWRKVHSRAGNSWEPPL